MAIFLSAARITEAIARLSGSRAKAALFDFLVVKRTFAIKGATAVAITETEPTFIEALDEFGACGDYKGHAVKPDTAFYLNPFVTREKGRQGYRQKRYRSNGTNSTIGGTHWRTVIALSNDDPRKASLAPEYLDHVEALLLKGGSEQDKPNLTEVAAWYFRGQDIQAVMGHAATAEQKLEALTQELRTRVGLTNDEAARLLTTNIIAVTDDAFVTESPSPLAYLPGEAEPEPIVAVGDVGSCSLDLVIALAAKNFVILTGPSGTGKSRSALRLAESIQHAYADKVNGATFELVTVGPDWTSPKRLLGYRTPFGKLRKLKDETETNESYEITNTVRLLLRASHPDVAEVPHFLIFDEMNLSHVERYFAPFLSLMEAANVLDEKAGVTLIDEQDVALIAELLKTENSESAEARAAEALVVDGRSFTIPSNVFFVGTVNVDETTYMFSPKVLDRAHVIELESQKPSSYLLGEAVTKAGDEISVQQALELLQASIEDREERRNEFPNPAQILDRIKDLGFTDPEIAAIKRATARALDGCFTLLLPVGFPFGYRIPKEIFAYLRAWIAAAMLRGTAKEIVLQQWPDALDRAVLQKVLPKIHGNKRTLGDSLRATKAFLVGGHTGSGDPARYTIGINTTVAVAETDALALGVNPQMKLSVAKLQAMHDRLIATGYVSFVS